MQKTSVTTWEFLKEMFAAKETVGIMAYEAKGQAHKATQPTQQLIQTRADAVQPSFNKKLRFLNLKGLNMVVCANPLQDGAKTRSKDTVKEVRHLVADIDTRVDKATGHEVTGKERLAAMLADPACPRPYFILNTSPDNYQTIWRVEGFNREQAEAVQKALGAFYGGDPNISTDLSRGVRLPGLHNKKYEETFSVICEYGEKITYRPEAFAYLPAPQLVPHTPPPQQTQLPASMLPTALPQMDAPARGTRPSQPSQSPYRNTGADTSGSGVDWALANKAIGTELRKQGVANFNSILAAQRPVLEASGRERGKPNPKRYADTTIEKLRAYWTPKLAEYTFTPVQYQAASNANSFQATPAVPAPRPAVASTPSPERSEARTQPDVTDKVLSTPATNTAPVPAAVELATVPQPPITSVPPAALQEPPVGAPPPGVYTPTSEERAHDAFCIQQDLRDGQPPAEIYRNMLEWRLNGAQGGEDYVRDLIVEQQRAIQAETLLAKLRTDLPASAPELETFRKALGRQEAGEGVLSVSVMALQLGHSEDGHSLYSPVAGSPFNDPHASDHAFRLATMAFTHGDTVSGVEQALTLKYHPNQPSGSTPPYLAEIVLKAQSAQALSLNSQEREHLR